MKRTKKSMNGDAKKSVLLDKIDLSRPPRSEWGHGFVRGVEAAADIADQYNGVTLHDHRLGDCILGKLNLRKGRPRKNEPSAWMTRPKEVGEYVRVISGNGTGTEGKIDFVDRAGKRYLVDAGGGRAGGLEWYSIEQCYIPAHPKKGVT